MSYRWQEWKNPSAKKSCSVKDSLVRKKKITGGHHVQPSSGECRQAADTGMPELDGTGMISHSIPADNHTRGTLTPVPGVVQATHQSYTNTRKASVCLRVGPSSLKLVFTLYRWFLAVSSEVMWTDWRGCCRGGTVGQSRDIPVVASRNCVPVPSWLFRVGLAQLQQTDWLTGSDDLWMANRPFFISFFKDTECETMPGVVFRFILPYVRHYFPTSAKQTAVKPWRLCLYFLC